MRLAIDAMGNDNGHMPILQGVRRFLDQEDDATVILVGREEVIGGDLAEAGLAEGERVEVVHASQIIEMEDKLNALKEKRDSSIGKVIELIRDGEADAMVALGNTMAVVAGTRFRLRYLDGVHRAGIAVPMPSESGVCVTIDMGANINAKPKHLSTYGIMASAYAELVLGIENPRVGLLNVGSEEVKGNELCKEAYVLLSKAPVNFVGNVEGGDIFNGNCDVVVCDGFVGNAVLKAAEEVANVLVHVLKDAIGSSVLSMAGAWLAKPAFDIVKEKTTYDRYGGAPLLGVNGVCIIGHGRSNARAVMNALRVARESVASGVNEVISDQLATAGVGKRASETPDAKQPAAQ